jgi:dTDP-glucose 4,6-dehydratase
MVLLLSSFSVYGRLGPERLPVNEATPFAPDTPYGQSKLMAEQLISMYSLNYGLSGIVFRAPLICGENQEEMNALREFVDSALRGDPIKVYGSGVHVREWLHPLDVAKAFDKALKAGTGMLECPQTFVLGASPISMIDLATKVVKSCGRGEIIQDVPPDEGHISRIFSQYTDHSKALRILGWHPEIQIEQIISRVVHSISIAA